MIRALWKACLFSRRIVMFLFVLSIFPFPAFAQPSVSSGIILLEWRDDAFIFKVARARIEDIVREVRRRCNVTLDGLDRRGGETVSFEFQGSRMETGFRQFMRHLNIRNYAFEYLDNELIRVSVLAEGVALPAPDSSMKDGQRSPMRPSMTHVVEIQEVIPGSQAERLNLMVGDVIVTYDHQRISMPQQLVRMVTEKAEWETIDLLILRKGEPYRYLVNGGLIGVRIGIAEIPVDEVDGIEKFQ